MLTGKTAIVTGGSRGIGAAIAYKLASLGAFVAVIYAGNRQAAEKVCERCEREYGAFVRAYQCDVSDHQAVKDTVALVKKDFGTVHILVNNAGITRDGREYGAFVRAYQCDVSDHQAVKDTVALVKKDFGTVHILVNNAGITRDGLLAMMSPEQFETVLDTNLMGAFSMMRHCVGMFLKNREGCIINISSISGITGNAGQCNYAASKAGLIGLTKSAAKELAPRGIRCNGCIINISSISGITGNAGQCNYAASKAGLIGLTKSAAKELAPRGIRCNAVAPGFIATDMTEDIKEHPLISQIPLGRMGRPEDVAEAVAYLAEASYVTGQVLQIDGGIAM